MSWQHTACSLDALLAPISDNEPCGPSLRHDPVLDRLRELRREDDPTLPAGVWQAELKQGNWAGVEDLASQLLCSRSKDLMLAAWLGEAWLMRLGLAGAAPALGLLAGLCEGYPDDLHPQPQEGDRSWRLPPFEWLVRRYGELLLTRIPLFGEQAEGFAQFTLLDLQQLRQRQVQASDSKVDKASAEAARQEQRRLNDLLGRLPASVFADLAREMDASLAGLARLEAWCGDWLADDAPSFTPLRRPLEAIRACMQEQMPMSPESPALSAPIPEVTREPTADQPAIPMDAPPASREEAYRQLARIADYLARTEPHSPVPYVIRRAVEWGNQPLGDLLDELISADAEARRLWKLLGVLK